MKTKVISVTPQPDVSAKIDQIAKDFRTSRAGFCNVALEFVLPLIESGEMAVVNGRLQYVGRPSEAAEKEVCHD